METTFAPENLTMTVKLAQTEIEMPSPKFSWGQSVENHGGGICQILGMKLVPSYSDDGEDTVTGFEWTYKLSRMTKRGLWDWGWEMESSLLRNNDVAVTA